MKWLRLWVEWGHDPKVQSMPEHMRCRHIMLLCLRRQTNTAKLTDAEIAHYMRIDMDELQKTKKLFEEKKFIDNGWDVLAWESRQMRSDLSTPRVQKHRETKSETLPKRSRNGDETSRGRHGNGLEKRREEEKREEKKKIHTLRKKEILKQANEIYDLYPKKASHKLSIERIVARLNAGEDFEQLKQALKNFTKFAIENYSSEEYYPHASTFFSKGGQWTEFLIEVAKCINCTKERPVIELNEAGVCAGSCRR